MNRKSLHARRATTDPRNEGLRRHIEWPLKIEATSSRDGLRAADQYCGMLATAVIHDDARWLDVVRHQLHRDRSGRVQGAGLTVFPDDSPLRHQPWYTWK